MSVQWGEQRITEEIEMAQHIKHYGLWLDHRPPAIRKRLVLTTLAGTLLLTVNCGTFSLPQI
jgi:hypothetical protein